MRADGVPAGRGRAVCRAAACARRALGASRSIGERGFAIVVVLWIFIVLFGLGAEFAQGMRQDATAALNFADETQSYYLATAAANLTFYRALQMRDAGNLDGQAVQPVGDEAPPPPLVQFDGEWHQEDLWGATVWVKATDEGGRLSINSATEDVLLCVINLLGVPPKQASEIADGILDWRDRDDDKRLNGAESEYYQSLPQPYVAKNAPLDSIEELLLVKGVTPELFYGHTDDFPIGLKDVFTVFNPHGKLNVTNATPDVLKAIFKLDKDEMSQLLDTREGGQAAALLPVLQTKVGCPTLAGMLEQRSPSVVGVEVQAKLPSSRISARMSAVVDVTESNEGVTVLRWMDSLPAGKVP